MQGHHEKAEEIQVDSGNSGRDKRGVIIEDANKEFREGQQKNPDGRQQNKPGNRGEFYAAAHAPVLFGAVVIPHNRLGGTGEPIDRHAGDFTHGINNRHDAYIKVAAKSLQGCIADNLYAAVGHGHDKA